MSLRTYAVPVALALSLFLAVRAAGGSGAEDQTVAARELLDLAQRAGGQSFTFSQETGAALAGASVPRPAAGASYAELESALLAAGFRLRPVGPAVRVERAGP